MSGDQPTDAGMVRRVLGLLGWPSPGPDGGPVVRQVGRPVTVGHPIVQPPEDDVLTVTSWTTQPRISADGGAFGTLTVRAASVNGRRHARQGTSREDAYAVSPATGGVVVATADGVGDEAARYSAVGSQIASVEARWLAAACLHTNWAIDVNDLCRAVSTAMTQGAGRFVPGYHEPRTLATTLTVVWVSTGGAYAGFRIGDGEIFELTGTGLTPAGPPPGGSFTETSALPHSWSAPETLAGQLAPGAALIVVTDGLSVPMRSPDHPTTGKSIRSRADAILGAVLTGTEATPRPLQSWCQDPSRPSLQSAYGEPLTGAAERTGLGADATDATRAHQARDAVTAGAAPAR